MKARKKSRLAVLAVLVLCISMIMAGCSGSENTDKAGDSQVSDVEENAAESTEAAEDAGKTEDAANTEDAAHAPGVYAEARQIDNKIEITPVPGGITDSTVLPTFKCTFGDMTDEAQKALEEGRTFPKEFFRDLTACMLISEKQMEGKEHDAIMFSLSTLAAMANEFWSLEPSLKSVEYESGDDGSIVKSIYNVHFESADKDGQIIYDNPARKWYLGETEYSGSLDSQETIAMWWTVFDVANGDAQ